MDATRIGRLRGDIPRALRVFDDCFGLHFRGRFGLGVVFSGCLGLGLRIEDVVQQVTEDLLRREHLIGVGDRRRYGLALAIDQPCHTTTGKIIRADLRRRAEKEFKDEQ